MLGDMTNCPPDAKYHSEMEILQRCLKGLSFVSGVGLLISAIGLLLNQTSTAWQAWTTSTGAAFAILTTWNIRQLYIALTEHDQRLFAEFKALFAGKGLIRAYREHDFLQSFRQDYLVPLHTVAETWDDAAHSFTNKRLEKLRTTFVKAATDLAVTIAGNTIPSGAFVTVIPRGMDSENLSDVVKQEATEINSKIKPFVDAHEALMREGNRLGAKPILIQPTYKREPDIEITEKAVFAYLLGSARLNDLTHSIAKRRKLDVERLTHGLAWLNERLALVGVKTIRELDEYVAKYGALAEALENYFSPMGAIDVGYLLQPVLDIVVIERDGIEGLRDLYKKVQLGSGHDPDYIYQCFLEAKDAQSHS